MQICSAHNAASIVLIVAQNLGPLLLTNIRQVGELDQVDFRGRGRCGNGLSIRLCSVIPLLAESTEAPSS